MPATINATNLMMDSNAMAATIPSCFSVASTLLVPKNITNTERPMAI